ncbi:MAG: PepSY domain-containing protein, partial [Chitinophagaceae bacterium]|nr:PepSY domain-containing protein [Rubrivivax sp.]
MSSAALRGWSWVHKWSSLVCTVFMLLLCITGLPLVFSDEIEHLSDSAIQAPPMAAHTPRTSLDAVVQAAVAQHPGKLPLYIFADDHDPDIWLVKLDTRVDSDERQAVFAAVDARSGRVLGTPVFNEGVMHFLYRLHVDLFAGEAGRLFLGAMGLLLVVAIVTGAVLYAPFMRRLAFGTVRVDRSPQLHWLDLHNLLGIVTLVWALAVGATGIINTWANQILRAWQADQLATLRALPLPAAQGESAAMRPNITPVQRAVDQALAARPKMKLSMVAFPGTILSTSEHFAVLLAGDTPLTARLQEPVLVQSASGRLTAAPPRPWYVTALQVSQPLHFGDYGGLPLKLLWGALDIATIVVLWSGLVLWWRKQRRTKSLA